MFRNGRIFNIEFFNGKLRHDLLLDIALNPEDNDDHDGRYYTETESDGLFARRDIYNGSFSESFDALVTSNGTTVTLTVTNSVSGNLTMQFSDGDTTFTGGTTIALTAGDDDDPRTNYVYIPQSTKVLTLATDNFPTDAEHIKVAFLFVSSATKTQSDGGALINQNWNDHRTGTDNEGHLLHLAEQNRYQKGYFSGLDADGTDQSPATSYFNFVGAAEAYFKSTSGTMYQLHRHSMPAINTQTGDDIHVANWSGDNYHEINNIADIVADSLGNSLANSYFNVFFFDVGNKTDEYTPLIALVPDGSYNSQTAALNDTNRLNNTTMPREFGLESSVGVPVCLMTLRWTGNLTTLSHIATEDFRQGGGQGSVGAGGTTEFSDSQFDIFHFDDETQVIAFDAINITPGETRVITMADANVDLADIATNTAASHTQGTDTTLGTQAEDLDMGFFDIVNPDNMDGSVDPTAITDLSNLDAYWRGEGDLLDSSGNDFDLIKQSGTTLFEDIGATKGLCFDGSTEHECDGTGAANPYNGVIGTGARAISMWVNLDRLPSTAAANMFFVVYGDTSAGANFFHIGAALTNDLIGVFYGNGNSVSDVAVVAGQRTHILVTCADGATYNDLKIYINNVDTTITAANPGTSINTVNLSNLFVGSRGGSEFTEGCIDEIAVFDDVNGDGSIMTSAQVSDIYNRQKERIIQGTGMPDPRNTAERIKSLTGFNTDGNDGVTQSVTVAADLMGGVTTFTIKGGIITSVVTK